MLTPSHQYLDRMHKFMIAAEKSNAAPFEKISADEAAQAICSSTHVDSESIVGFDSSDAARLKLRKGESVAIAPTDSGTQRFMSH